LQDLFSRDGAKLASLVEHAVAAVAPRAQ
jgi:hypothetical protein